LSLSSRGLSRFAEDGEKFANERIGEDPFSDGSAKEFEQLVFRQIERPTGEPSAWPPGKTDFYLPKFFDPQTLNPAIVELRSSQFLCVGCVSHPLFPCAAASMARKRRASRSLRRVREGPSPTSCCLRSSPGTLPAKKCLGIGLQYPRCALGTHQNHDASSRRRIRPRSFFVAESWCRGATS
jgi:hypothetical protein